MISDKSYRDINQKIKSICNDYGYSLDKLTSTEFQVEGAFFCLYYSINIYKDNSIIWNRLEFDTFSSADNLNEYIELFKGQVYRFMKDVEFKIK